MLDNFERRYLNPQTAAAITTNSNTTTFPVSSGDDDSRPLTYVEKELATVAKDRAALPFALQSSQTLRGIQFPIDQDAAQLLKAFARGDIDFVQCIQC